MKNLESMGAELADERRRLDTRIVGRLRSGKKTLADSAYRSRVLPENADSVIPHQDLCGTAGLGPRPPPTTCHYRHLSTHVIIRHLSCSMQMAIRSRLYSACHDQGHDKTAETARLPSTTYRCPTVRSAARKITYNIIDVSDVNHIGASATAQTVPTSV